jgi:hypothetical protein
MSEMTEEFSQLNLQEKMSMKKQKQRAKQAMEKLREHEASRMILLNKKEKDCRDWWLVNRCLSF